MGRYPRSARSTRLKCIDCNAPVVRTVDDTFACVDCGDAPIEPAGARRDDGERSDVAGELRVEAE